VGKSKEEYENKLRVKNEELDGFDIYEKIGNIAHKSNILSTTKNWERK
jgi:hypothetical protein